MKKPNLIFSYQLIIPLWFAWIAWGENRFPGISDFLIRMFYTNNQQKSGRK
jgi:hypothetical protein